MSSAATYREPLTWQPERPRFRLVRVATTWILAALALMAAAWVVPGASIEGFWGALLVSAIVAGLNAVLPPLLAALRLPFTLVAGFLLVLLADADAGLLREVADLVLLVGGNTLAVAEVSLARIVCHYLFLLNREN